MEFAEFFQMIKVPVTVVHVLAVVLGMGGALVSDILFSFFAKDKKLDSTEIATLSILARIILWSLGLIFISGLALFLSDVDRYLHSAKFLAKMSILAVLLVNGYFLNKLVWPQLLDEGFFTLESKRGSRRLAFACGAVSVISWVSVCSLGVLNRVPMSYPAIIAIYLGIILFGICVALVVEKKELN